MYPDSKENFRWVFGHASNQMINDMKAQASMRTLMTEDSAYTIKHNSDKTKSIKYTGKYEI